MRVNVYLICALLLTVLPLVGQAANLDESVYWADKTETAVVTPPVVTPPTTGAAKTFDTIEAEAFDNMGGALLENGDTTVGSFDNGDWLTYNSLKFNPLANAIDFTIASATSGGKFEVRLDSMTGTRIGECMVQATGGRGVWKDVHVPITPVTGTHDLIIVGLSGAAICSFDKFALVMTKTVTPPTGPPMPDLVVTQVMAYTPANPKAGDVVTFGAIVKNQGTAATPEGTILGMRWLVDAPTLVIWSDNETSSLPAGNQIALLATGGTAGATWTATKGTHTITATVDDANRFMESDETNNQMTWTLTIP
jgi:hypothetical protein